MKNGKWKINKQKKPHCPGNNMGLVKLLEKKPSWEKKM
jgi:hypothetical protein